MFLNEGGNQEGHIAYQSIRYDNTISKNGQLYKSEFGTSVLRTYKESDGVTNLSGIGFGYLGSAIQTLLGSFLCDRAAEYTLQDIYNTNEGALAAINKNLGRKLFKEYSPHQSEIEGFHATAAKQPPPATFFKAEAYHLHEHARLIKNVLENPYILQKNTNKKFLFHLPDIHSSPIHKRIIDIIASPYGAFAPEKITRYDELFEILSSMVVDLKDSKQKVPTSSNVSYIIK